MEYLIVDGYNIINEWPELKKIMKEESIENSRNRLLEILSNYQGYKKINIIVVFDAHMVNRSVEKNYKYDNIYIVFTSQNKTADSYIEKFIFEYGKHHKIRVATSDAVIQSLVLGSGGIRVSAPEIRREIQDIVKKRYKEYKNNDKTEYNNRISEQLPQNVYDLLEKIRLNSKKDWLNQNYNVELFLGFMFV